MRSPSFRLSSSTGSAIAKLTSWATLNQRWKGEGNTFALLEQIGQANEPLAIPELLSFGFVSHREVRIRARSIIAGLFAQFPIDSLLFLDKALHQSWAHLYDWYGMRPENIEDLAGQSDSDHLYYAMLTCHRDGFVRAEALRSIAHYPSTTVLPFVLMRLVDWVREVSLLAEYELRKRLQINVADAVVGVLGLLGNLVGNSRYRPEYSQWVDDLLKAPECAGALLKGMTASSRAIRRKCFQIARDNPALEAGAVMEQALADADVIVRKSAFAAAFQTSSAGVRALTGKAARDRYGPIRNIALETMAAESAFSIADFEPFLFDRSAVIRKSCQALVSKRFQIAPAEFYRTVIEISNPQEN